MHKIAPLSGLGLRITSWTVLVAGLGIVEGVSLADPESGSTALTWCLATFFCILLVRLGRAAVRQRARRGPLLLLLLGVLLWAAGSASVNGSGQPDLTKFPAPGEWLFLASYAGIAGFLILDVAKRVSTAAATWLETVVICGGAICLAGSLLVTPASRSLGRQDLGLLVALVYPLVDIILGLLVVAQVALHARGRLVDNTGLIAGFGVLAAVDSSFLVHHGGNGTYDYSILSIAMWGLGFVLIVDSATKSRPRHLDPQSARGVTPLVVTAGLAAGTVLAFQEQGLIRDYLVLPALVTLCAAGLRLGPGPARGPADGGGDRALAQ